MQRVKHQLAHRVFDAAQTLHLFGFQPRNPGISVYSARRP
jgi:hypothetical protein